MTSARRPALALAPALALLLALPAAAHKPSDSYLSLRADRAQITGQWDIAVRDLDDALGLDDDDDGAISWGELRRHEPAISAYALSRLGLSMGGEACPTKATALQIDDHSDGAYAVLRITAACPREGPVRVIYSLLWDLDPSHRGLLRLDASGSLRTAVFSPDHREETFGVAGTSAAGQLGAFVKEGAFHIWSGFDHILFLLALLLPAVLRREQGRWVPAESARSALREVLKVVTSFTIAHSVTLSLSTLGLVSLPSRWVESAIALSVLLAALNNLWPILRGRAWAFAFGFGLLHGFGFASVLVDLGLPRARLATALFGFNVGVELGQLAVVGAFFAVAYALRATKLYRRVALSGGSVLIACMACVWLVERAFDVRVF